LLPFLLFVSLAQQENAKRVCTPGKPIRRFIPLNPRDGAKLAFPGKVAPWTVPGESKSSRASGNYSSRQGERSGQWRMTSVAQAVVLSVWQEVHGFGILYLSVMSGVINANVCERTFTSAIVVAILGMWQAMQLLPVEPFL
jgi:hypothetical protein